MSLRSFWCGGKHVAVVLQLWQQQCFGTILTSVSGTSHQKDVWLDFSRMHISVQTLEWVLKTKLVVTCLLISPPHLLGNIGRPRWSYPLNRLCFGQYEACAEEIMK